VREAMGVMDRHRLHGNVMVNCRAKQAAVE
jgi:hypothetical protein